MPRAKPSIVAEDERVDEQPENASVTEPDAEGIPEPVAEALAKRMGWKPREEWKRDPEKWTPASQFLEGTVGQVEDLRARNLRLEEEKERAAQAAAAMLESERARIREEARRTIRTSPDADERDRAASTLAENAGPPPETRAWLAQHPWFETDPIAQAVAKAVIEPLVGRVSIAGQLVQVEDELKRRFPERFAATEPRPNGEEQRLSDVRRQAPNPPQVQQGSRAATENGQREKGFREIPAADRDAFRRHMLRQFMAKGWTQEKAETEYATAYWKANVTPPNERGDEPYPMSPQSNVWTKRLGRTR